MHGEGSNAPEAAWEEAFWDASRTHPKQQVLLDILHAMKRIRDTLPAQHTLKHRFMGRLRDLIFIIDAGDVQKQMEVLMKDGWSKDQVEDLYISNYHYFVMRARRSVPKPQDLLPGFQKLQESYTPTAEHPLRGFCPHTKLYLLGKQSTQDKLRTLQEHISNGCMSDPHGVALYVNVGTAGRPKWHCMRGTSALEGFHAHIRRFMSSHCTSPRLAQAMLMSFVYRWNQRINVNNRGGVAFVHEDLELMHRIHRMERKVSADTDGRPAGVEGLLNVDAFADSKETFGFGALPELSEEMVEEEVRLYILRAHETGLHDEPGHDDDNDNENANLDTDPEAALKTRHADELAKGWSRLPPSHRWTAIAMSPQNPSRSAVPSGVGVQNLPGSRGCQGKGFARRHSRAPLAQLHIGLVN